MEKPCDSTFLVSPSILGNCDFKGQMQFKAFTSTVDTICVLASLRGLLGLGQNVLFSRSVLIWRKKKFINVVGVMSFKSGCDISGEVVLTKIQWVQYLIQGVWCHAWSGCDIINTVVWCDRVYAMSSAVQRMSRICRVWCHQHRVLWCHTYWILCHIYRGYDFTDILDVIPYI